MIGKELSEIVKDYHQIVLHVWDKKETKKLVYVLSLLIPTDKKKGYSLMDEN